MPQLTLRVDKGWMPDMIPYEAPDGTLSDMRFCVPFQNGWRTLPAPTEGSAHLSAAPYRCESFIHSNGNSYVFIADAYHNVYRCTRSGTTWTVSSAITSPYYTASDANTGAAVSARFVQWGDWLVILFHNRPPQVLKDFATGTALENLSPTMPIARFGAYIGHHLMFGHISPGIFMSSTDQAKIAVSRFGFEIAGVKYESLATQAVEFPKPTDHTITANKWGLFLLTIDSTLSITVTAAAESYSATGYDSFAAALAAKPSIPTGSIEIGCIVLKTKTDTEWHAGDDALMGGTKGNPASQTVYYASQMIANGTATTSRATIWTNFEDITKMDASTSLTITNETGSDAQVLYQLQGPITDVLPSGLYDGMIFGRKGIVRVTYTGGDAVYNFRSVDDTVGCAPNTAVSTRAGLFFANNYGFYRVDNNGAQRISKHFVEDTIFANITVSSGAYAACYEESTNSVFWLVILAGPAYYIIGYEVTTGRWYVADYGTASTFVPYIIGTFDSASNVSGRYPTGLVEVRYEGSVMEVHFFDVIVPTDTAYVVTKEFQISENMLSRISKVRPKVHGYTTAPTVTIYSRMNEDDTWTESTASAVGSRSGWADCQQTGRYHKIKCTLGGGTLTAIDVMYELAGGV